MPNAVNAAAMAGVASNPNNLGCALLMPTPTYPISYILVTQCLRMDGWTDSTSKRQEHPRTRKCDSQALPGQSCQSCTGQTDTGWTDRHGMDRQTPDGQTDTGWTDRHRMDGRIPDVSGRMDGRHANGWPFWREMPHLSARNSHHCEGLKVLLCCGGHCEDQPSWENHLVSNELKWVCARKFRDLTKERYIRTRSVDLQQRARWILLHCWISI